MRIDALLLAFLCASGFTAEWKDAKEYRWRELPKFEGTHAGFKLLSTTETGVAFTNIVSETGFARNRVVENGSGVALGDFDGDGLPDIFACAIESDSRLFRNLGNFKFRDVTAAAGLPTNFRNGRGAVFADINGDGQLDLLISTLAEGVRCFINTNGKFAETTDSAGLRKPCGSTTLALADIDGNGTLDLYVATYRTNDIRDVGRLSVKNVGGKPYIPPELRTRFTMRGADIAELGEPDQLYLNDGKGHFTPVSWTAGAFLDADGKPLKEAPLDWGLTATFRDVNNDGAPDLYVCNDYWTPDRFWINDGKGHFRAAAPFAVRKIPSSSMGVDFADINRDGILDFFAVDMLASDVRARKRQSLADKPVWPSIGVNADLPQVFQNTLFLGRDDGTYAEAAYYAGLEATDWSWSPQFLDIDLDGFEDLLISAGHFRDVQDLDAKSEIQRRQHSWAGYTNELARQTAYSKELMEHYRLYPLLEFPVRAYRNGGDVRFREMSGDWGFTKTAVRHGMALADLDLDGDLDLVANCLNGPLEIYRNDADAGRVAIHLKGGGIGAKLVFKDPIGLQQKEIIAGGAYESSSEARAVFALRPGTKAALDVQWRSGKKSSITGIESNRTFEIIEPTEGIAAKTEKAPAKPLFEDVSDRIAHEHQETPFDDYTRQPTLPFKLSQQGPGVAWFDLNSDGNDDLIIGSGAGAAPAIFYSDSAGKFTPGKSGEDSTGDLLGLIGWDKTILAAVSGYKMPSQQALLPFDASQTKPLYLPTNIRSASVLASGCFAPPDGMALFVGGGIEPARYPLATPSALLRFENGQWKYDARNSSLLANIGLVNGAVWSDLDNDGISELILACEWGPIRVFSNRGSLLTEITKELGLEEATGLWKGIATADIDGDGRLDIIAANWGLNSPWRASKDRPFTAYYGEIVQPGRIEFIETEWDAAASSMTPRRPLERLASALPFVSGQFRTFKEFAEAPIMTLLGERKVLAKQVTANALASTVFLNRGGNFEARELPLETQLAPAFSVNAADFDGDGNVDIFLSQNFIAMHADYSRQDAGRGLLLKGNGRGGFRALTGDESGIKIYGEQRGAAVCDFDSDGRLDLAVTQNGAQTKLYRNTSAKPGVRVILEGPAKNSAAIGAQLWLEQSGNKSALQEIQSGSGYLSQNSRVKIVPPVTPAKIIVRWPGGATSSTPLPTNSNILKIKVPSAPP